MWRLSGSRRGAQFAVRRRTKIRNHEHANKMKARTLSYRSTDMDRDTKTPTAEGFYPATADGFVKRRF